jgi:hypothetical protein
MSEEKKNNITETELEEAAKLAELIDTLNLVNLEDDIYLKLVMLLKDKELQYIRGVLCHATINYLDKNPAIKKQITNASPDDFDIDYFDEQFRKIRAAKFAKYKSRVIESFINILSIFKDTRAETYDEILYDILHHMKGCWNPNYTHKDIKDDEMKLIKVLYDDLCLLFKCSGQEVNANSLFEIVHIRYKSENLVQKLYISLSNYKFGYNTKFSITLELNNIKI